MPHTSFMCTGRTYSLIVRDASVDVDLLAREAAVSGVGGDVFSKTSSEANYGAMSITRFNIHLHQHPPSSTSTFVNNIGIRLVCLPTQIGVIG
jgi:hypothetical protein